MAFAGLIGLVVIAVRVWDALYPPCGYVIIDRLPSPDGRWNAVIDESTCDVGLLAMIAVVAGVDLTPTKQPAQKIELLGVDTGGHHDERPRVAWTAPNVLRVTVPLRSYLKILTRHADGVRVDLHFDPDDPAARAAWLKETGQDPDPPSDTTQ